MTFRAQQGNTFIGIIIGLVIGLVIAVIVALAITKGSTPFTDKANKAGKAAEPTSGQIADPNKPMYGNKDAAREAAKDFVHEPQQPAPAGAAQPAPAAQPPAADPLQAVVNKIQGTPADSKAKPAAPTASNVTPAPAAAKPAAAAADSGDDKFIYYLQAGAFREVADAEAARAKLALLGFEANISDRASDTGVLHRVRLGPYQQVEAMNRVRSKLSENGVDVAVVRNQK
jgi:cell division protein FtsN